MRINLVYRRSKVLSKEIAALSNGPLREEDEPPFWQGKEKETYLPRKKRSPFRGQSSLSKTIITRGNRRLLVPLM